MDDWQLLQDYAQSGSESAFGELIGRHLNLVYSSALRRVNDRDLAQEISQAVFILLARKAKSLPRKVVIAGWLFRTTRFVASRSLRAEQRRRQRDQEAYQMQTLTTPDNAWKNIAPILDEALEKLSETDRNALLLRFVEAKNHREVGATLGVNEEAARKRVDRALEKLRVFFASQGFTVSVAVLGSALLSNAAQASPAAVAASVKAAALAGASAGAGGTLPTLVNQTLDAWRWAWIKTVAIVVGTGVAVMALWVVKTTPQGAQPNIVSAKTSVTTNGKTASLSWLTKKNASAPTPTGRTFQVNVVDKKTGIPVTNARLAINTVAGGEWVPRFDLYTDSSGACDVTLPPELLRLDVGVIAQGWEARYATFRDGVLDQYTIRLEQVTNSIGGWLKDEAGHPVANAHIWIRFFDATDYSARETPRERMGFVSEEPVAISDSQGHWSCTIVPTKNPGFDLSAHHPDYPDTQLNGSAEEFENLRKGTLVNTMRRGITLAGHVVDREGRPVPNARITHSPVSDKPLNVTTDGEGRFIIPKLTREDFDFTVIAEGFAPEFRKVSIGLGMPPVEVRLEPGAILRLRIVDGKGNEVPGAEAVLEQWGEKRYVLPWNAFSADDGRIKWSSAPQRETLELCARKDGWCYTRDIRVVADGEEHLITLRRELKLSCHVTDAETGMPVAEFKAFPGYGEGNGDGVWERVATKQGTNGLAVVPFGEARQPWRVRVEAEGYEPAISEQLESDVTGLEIALKHAKSIRGVVILPDGRPAANIEVVALSLDYNVSVDAEQGKFRNLPPVGVIKTDSSGHFLLSSSRGVHSVVAVSPAGFGKQSMKDSGIPLVIQLQAWGRVEGTVAPTARRRQIREVLLWDETVMEYTGAARFDLSASVDESGHFVFEKVPSGAFSLFLDRGVGIPFSCRTEAIVRSGETTVVQIGGKGRVLFGKLAIQPGEVKDGTNRKIYATLEKVGSQPAPQATGLTGEAAARWAVTYWQSEAGRQYYSQRAPGVWLAETGDLLAEEVMPGTYTMKIFGPTSRLEKEIVVPETGSEDIDLGLLEMR